MSCSHKFMKMEDSSAADMTASNLVVPMILWGKNAPTHCISSILMTPNQKHIVTGCNDGHMCVWDVDSDWEIFPKNMLFGHSAAVTCLAMGSNIPEQQLIISSSDNGEICLWDIEDGRCIEHNKTPNVHTAIKTYQMIHARDVRLVCNGYYTDIMIVNPLTLEVVYSLTSRMQPDWISALCVLRPMKREDDVVVAISNSGTVKVWTLCGSEAKGSQPVFEDESKQIRCLNAQTLACCAYNQRTVLIVCSKYWQIYDAGDFSLLCSESSRRGERWSGGEFISIDRIVVWSTEGKGYLYKLPTNTNPDSPEYRQPGNPSNPKQSSPQAYFVLDMWTEKALECSPAMTYFLGRRDRESKLLLRGDSEGRVIIWTLPEIHDTKMKLVRQESFEKLPSIQPKSSTSLQRCWQSAAKPSDGIIDQLNQREEKNLVITASIFIPSQGRMVFGRDDGSIVIVPAVLSIILQYLDNGHNKDSLPHQILQGHNGRVNCLLYPYNDSPRYDQSHLLSGGVDFTVCLWDLNNGSKIHTFCVHGGEITQLIVPPDSCNLRILPCVCSVASDHSLALLSVKERKCVMLAARQMFPIQTVKWRPHDDFLVIGCTDGTVYVWQMETGHLDRVVHGVTAEEILNACDEKLDITISEKLTNPTISIAQAFRRHNLATFRNLAQQQLKKAQSAMDKQQVHTTHPSLVLRPQAAPMMVQGIRTNTKDPDSHIIYFDTESLIVQLLSEEYSKLSPNTLENMGFYTTVPKEVQGISETQKKVADFFSKVKDKAENVGHKIQAKAEEAGLAPVSPRMERKADGKDSKGNGNNRPAKLSLREDSSLVMDIAQLFLSCLHAWGVDPDLDKLCISKLGLLCPKRPISFGLVSRGGHMSLLLPGYHNRNEAIKAQSATGRHWQISSAITTQHLLSLISTANTLMSMTNAIFSSEKLSSGTTPSLHLPPGEMGGDFELDSTQQAQTKQGWSLLAALHCVLLPEKVAPQPYRAPLLEMLARRWQDRCLEIREAAQALLLAELSRIEDDGRRKVVEEWSPWLPSYVNPNLSLLAEQGVTAPQPPATPTVQTEEEEEDEEDGILGGGESQIHKMSQSFESRRKQATAIVMMGVIGAEFGAAMESRISAERRSGESRVGLQDTQHARHTSKALTFLLLQPPSARLPAYTPIRRAAVDLLGRGFTVWEPYLDVSAVLLGLLELCVDGDKLVPSMTFGLPLSPRADACRTARHALSLIASARPPAFIIIMAKEVARYNTMAQNAQGQHHAHQLHNSVLIRAKPEIIRVIELLVDKIPQECADLLVEVMDVSVHCLDQAAIKIRGLQEVFPAICRFAMVSYCAHTRRIGVGAKNGGIGIYELKQGKCQILPAHTGPVAAVAFSPDGKYLATYSYTDNKILFWQTASTGVFSLGSQQTKCVKTFNTQPIKIHSSINPLKLVKLVWVDNRTVVLLTADGTETRYKI